MRALLDDAFARLALVDPERHLRAAIARCPLDVIVDGIAVFEAKGCVGTLPPGVDARYLLSIVKNLGDEREGMPSPRSCSVLASGSVPLGAGHQSDWSMRRRRRDKDRDLGPEPDINQERSQLAAERRIDRRFWLLAVADEINTHAKSDPAPLVATAERRVHTTHR